MQSYYVPSPSYICNFCYRPNEAFRCYEDDTRELWISCKRCTELIESGQREELLNRAVAYHVVMHGGLSKTDPDKIRNDIQDAHNYFWDRY